MAWVMALKIMAGFSFWDELTIPLLSPLFQPLLHESNQNWHCWNVNMRHAERSEQIALGSWKRDPVQLAFISLHALLSSLRVWDLSLEHNQIHVTIRMNLFYTRAIPLPLSLSSISRVIALSYCPHVIGPSQCFVVIILTLMSYTDSQSMTIYIYM